jgi:hypothetical protein
MPAKQMNFYATYDDISKVLEQFEAEEHVVYVLTGLFDIDTPQVIATYRAINSLSVSVDGDANHVPGYLKLIRYRFAKCRKRRVEINLRLIKV